MIKYFLYSIVGASLLACSACFTPTFQIEAPTVIGGQSADPKLTTILQPYQDTLHSEFDAFIATAPEALIVSRPSSNLMNWCADAVLSQTLTHLKFDEPVICLLNTGGLRSSFGAGNLSLQDFYKLMPFDNRLVLVHFPVSKIREIEKYLFTSGGEPIANCVFVNGRLQIPSLLSRHEYIWVLTSDFLANGGDQMNFFLGLEKQETNILLRDIFIETARKQGELVLDAQLRYSK